MSEANNRATPSTHWAQLNESTSVLGMRILFWICRIFGRWPFRLGLYPVLLRHMLINPTARKASQAYFEQIRASGGTVLRLAVLRHFAAFAESLLDKMLLWGGLFKVSNVQFYGTDPIDARISAGLGGVLVGSHFGNMELCRMLARKRSRVNITVLVHTKHAVLFNRLLAQLDPTSRLNLMQVTEITPATAMLLGEKIAQGHFIVIAGDRVPVSGGRVAYADFLGKPAAFPVGPYLLASILHCPIYTLIPLHTSTGVDIHFELLSENIARREREAKVQQCVELYAQRLASFCLRAPLQWFNFYDFWAPVTVESVESSAPSTTQNSAIINNDKFSKVDKPHVSH